MIERQNRINELKECIKDHVNDLSAWLNSCELRDSIEFGCGIFATRDIQPNELLFSDKPLLLGPTGNKHEPIVCVICFEKIENDVSCFLCPGQCGLVLCGNTACANQHEIECQLLQKWKPQNPNEVSFNKLKAMLVIRSLFLDKKQRNIFNLMQKNYISEQNDIYFDDEFEHFPDDKETVAALRDASAAINTNTFKVLYRCDGSDDVSVRGFYSIMSLVNHKCSPNARHDIDKHFVGRIFAARPIKKDEQIFISYSQLLWGTNSRRMHMMVSKQFLCSCNRCLDPTENSTNLSAIRCLNKDCDGLVLPIDAINFKSHAKCNLCEKMCENQRFLQIQEMSALITKNFVNKDFTLSELDHFIEFRLCKLVPKSNQFVVESKLKAIRMFSGTTFEDQNKIQCFCEDILRIIDKLDVGECSLKGILAHRLYVIRQKLKEFPPSEFDLNGDDRKRMSISKIDDFLNDDEQLLKTAKIILSNTSTAPADIFDT
ncbi:SET domain-containing protein SmydA-8-like [Contarinia nasturtii]|uniref:SET domain-containing protein SmydA-8-like n=1 Tax=Contarinia nasturtii TaxID=265458 RepID=UPI0012D37EE6|nr:SET domain-containing protein SmydA-8-like [Contarinia nasturtii]